VLLMFGSDPDISGFEFQKELIGIINNSNEEHT
jgi:hypothetical protein